MASYVTNKGRAYVLSNDMSAADLRALLVTTAPASKAAAADLNFVSEVSANEVSVAGYSRVTLTGESVVEDDTGDEAVLTATDPGSFGSLAAGETVVGCWIFVQVTNDADSVLIAFLDSTDTPTNGGTISGVFGATAGGTDGILALVDNAA